MPLKRVICFGGRHFHLNSTAFSCGYHGNAELTQAAYKIRDNEFSSPRTQIEKQGAVNHTGSGVSSPRYLEWEETPCKKGRKWEALAWGKESDSSRNGGSSYIHCLLLEVLPSRRKTLSSKGKGKAKVGVAVAHTKSCQCRLPNV